MRIDNLIRELTYALEETELDGPTIEAIEHLRAATLAFHRSNKVPTLLVAHQPAHPMQLEIEMVCAFRQEEDQRYASQLYIVCGSHPEDPYAPRSIFP